MSHVLVIDNYDSFTYNLVQYLHMVGATCDVFLHDAISTREIAQRNPDGILLSPGPCTPDDAGVTLEVVREFAGKIPLFGVCLGHQAIGQAFGAQVVRAQRLMHGKTSPIHHDGTSIFTGLPSPMTATRYHSLLLEPTSLPPVFRTMAWTSEGEIMGIAHRELPVLGVQFHPESILTEGGIQLIRHWVTSLSHPHGAP